MLTLPDSHVEQLGRAELRPILMVRIDLDSPASRYFCAVSGNERRFGFPNNIDTMTPIQRKLDRQARTVSVGQVTVSFADDGWLYDLAQRYLLPGRLVTLSLGFPDDAEADYQPFYKGLIHDILPRGGTNIDLVCKDMTSALNDVKITGHWTGMHPIEVIADICQNFAAIPAAMIDYTSMDPTLYPTISHFSVSRAGKSAIYPWYNKEVTQESEIPALEVINDLLVLIDGILAPDENGVYTLRIFDIDAGMVDAWTSDDIADLEVLESWGDTIKNQITFTLDGTNADTGGANHAASYTGADETAQAAIATPGVAARVRSIQFSTEWLNGVQTPGWSSPVVTATTIRFGVVNAQGSLLWGLLPTIQGLGFCGTSVDVADRRVLTTPETWRQLNAAEGRYGYLLMGKEIVRVREPVTFSGAPTSSDEYGDIWWGYVTFTIDQRNWKSTPSWTGGNITDITIPVYMAQAYLDRFGYGAARVRVWTPLSKRAVQLGDFVSITDPIPLLYGSAIRGVDSTTAWEVTAKDEDILGDAPGVWWELQFVRTGTATASVVTPIVQPEQRTNTFLGALIDRASGQQIYDRATGQPVFKR